ncbi:MAG TPA: ABC transporter permease [Ferrovibrio sp.]|uniref:ABC transporter permease n=1 Tax=Ferrovibrio sp. TaxID=1917215 RepID=UPI002ED56721
MSLDILVPMTLTVIGAATPLLFAALGELVVERSGVLNLGVEGMMLAGAVVGFIAVAGTGSHAFGLLAAALAGAGMALLFGFLTLTLRANQVATGLALTIFGIGLSALIGVKHVGIPIPALPKLDIPGLSDLPVIGPLLFGHDILVYLSLALTIGIAWFLARTRQGLILRACGEADLSAHSIGYHVIRVRYCAVLFGGAMSGLGGAYLSMAATPMWIENMVAGRGWIALALVAFGSWRPWRVLFGAYLFGGVTILQLYLQGSGILSIPSQVMSMLPYLATIILLTVIASGSWRGRLDAPACLGKTFSPPS